MTTRSDLITALATGRARDLIGLAENGWLDFKSAPYALASGRNKFELCKDVAALANAQGGLLVLGVEAEKEATQAIEIATKLRPFPKNRANLDAYTDTLNDNLWPRVTVEFRWFEAPDDISGPDHFFLVIDVEPVPEADRYVIARRVLSEDDKLVDGFAVPQRAGDRTTSLPSLEVYRLMNDGLRSRILLPVPPLERGPGTDRADAMVDELEQVLDWNDKPALFWQSIPQNPPSIADPSMLCRGSDQIGPWLRISPFVLTELTLEYFRLADNVVMTKVPGQWRHRVVARRFRTEEKTLTLAPGIDLANTFRSDAQPASSSSWNKSWAAVGDPERDAYEALSRIYALFGVDVATNHLVNGDRVPITGFTE
ncbi:AlbA family DNA-binding domain-containing protein [Nonomuraea soli]|uniref:Schlafen AlbA-2 domain-containing protein n=1 Tax=Nonomuraea soli TaxID=1032476 RepID=A0A7W0HPE4_9ACTN|nr:ATP-binding protein [Nonomuraea soli]MBA2890783.1 hypothetical protein [Nonomuraea soli]